jgi:hypothetical protein
MTCMAEALLSRQDAREIGGRRSGDQTIVVGGVSSRFHECLPTPVRATATPHLQSCYNNLLDIREQVEYYA